MKKKFIDGSDIDSGWLLKYSSKYQYLEGEYQGYISLITIDEVQYKISVDYDDSDTCLVDNGYKCMIYLPIDKNWCVSVFMNEADEIIEWYFDMTKENGLENGEPFFRDLYLDIAVSSDRIIKILDEDELIEALKLGVITHDDYLLANKTCKHLIESVIPNEAFMTEFFYEQLESITNRMI